MGLFRAMTLYSKKLLIEFMMPLTLYTPFVFTFSLKVLLVHSLYLCVLCFWTKLLKDLLLLTMYTLFGSLSYMVHLVEWCCVFSLQRIIAAINIVFSFPIYRRYDCSVFCFYIFSSRLQPVLEWMDFIWMDINTSWILFDYKWIGLLLLMKCFK